MDDETFATEHEPWVRVHNNRKRRNVALAGCLLVVASLVALILGLTMYDKGGQPRSVNSATGPGESQAPVASPPPSTLQPTIQTLFMFLQQHSLYDGSELEDNASYQYKAYIWLESTSYDSLPEWRILQRFSLACIYHATFQVRTLFTDTVYGYDADIPAWNNTENWLSSENECTWFGILCDNDRKVNNVELYSNSLTGSFPPEVVYLKKFLIALDLYDNVIWNNGDQGHKWLEQLTNLEYLFYANTFFQYDGIPTHIGALTNLVEYDCSSTLYFGELRGEIFTNLTQLQYLVMGDNSYNMATIPSEIINLPNLQYLYLHKCDLQGDLEFLPTMKNLQEFWIDKNEGIRGTIPTDIGQLSGLVSFSATECLLSGPLPSELGLLTNLRKFWASRNALSGTIPAEIGNVTELEILELYDNAIMGAMPNPICNLVIPAAMGGNLSLLVVDCELNCTCCTSCQ